MTPNVKVAVLNDYPTVVGGAERFLVNPHTAEKLVERILEILPDDVLLRRISTAARENIRLARYNGSEMDITEVYKAKLRW